MLNLTTIQPSAFYHVCDIYRKISCQEEGDEYSIVWPASAANTNVTLSCLSGTGT